jgi:hypothetical protein
MESESSTSVPLKKKPKKVQERPVKMDPVEMIRVESEVCSKLASILRSLQDIDVSVLRENKIATLSSKSLLNNTLPNHYHYIITATQFESACFRTVTVMYVRRRGAGYLADCYAGYRAHNKSGQCGS